jgi:hypothetical protein
MSLATFKRKSINKYSSATKRSGKPSANIWLPQGPFGNPGSLTSVLFNDGLRTQGTSGFSLNGSQRDISINKTMVFSQQGTRYKGIHPVGHGGSNGKYYQAEPLLNANHAKVEIRGNQRLFIKQSTLSTQGMLEKRFRWIHSGQYPNYWVQPLYTGNQSDSASQGAYIQNLSAQNDCVVDTNDTLKYVGHIKQCCQGYSLADGNIMTIQQSTAPYTKTINVPRDSSQHTTHIQQKCANPTLKQQPYPGPVQTGASTGAAGTSVTTGGNSCNTSNYTLTPSPS